MKKRVWLAVATGLQLALSGFAAEADSAKETTAEYEKPRVNVWPLFTVDQDNYNILGMNHERSTDVDADKKTDKKPVDKPKVKSKDGEEDPKHYVGLFPIYTQVWNSEENTVLSFPLFWYGNNPDNRYLNICGPVYHYYRNKNAGTSYSAMVWPLVEYEFGKDGKLDNWHFWPLVSINNPWPSLINSDPNHFGALLLYQWNSAVYDQSRLPRGNQYNPLKDNKKMSRAVREESNSCFFPLWFQNSERWAVWKADVDAKKLTEAVNALDVLEKRCYDCGKGDCTRRWHHRRNVTEAEKKEAQEKLQKLLPELKITLEVPAKGKQPDYAAVRRQLAEKYTAEVAYKHYFALPVFWNYQAVGGDSRWSTLLFLTGGSGGKESASFHVLEYLYRYEREGEVRSQFIFPFIMTKTAPERSSFSFLWRVYDRITESGKSSGHIMFIPF